MRVKSLQRIIGVVDEIDSESREKLLKMGLPPTFLEKSFSSWLANESNVSYFNLDSIKQITTFDYQEHLIKFGFLSIGSCPNGDVIALKFDESNASPIVFISHEHEEGMYGSEAPVWAMVSHSFDAFVRDADVNENYPSDYFEAKESGVMGIEHPWFRRVSWHPFVAAIPFLYMLYSISVKEFTVVRVVGTIFVTIYFFLSLYNYFSANKLLDGLYRPDGE